MSKIVSNKIFYPARYVESVTGKFYSNTDTLTKVEDRLTENGLDFWSYRLDEVEEALNNANENDIVLVALTSEENFAEHEFRWFEYVPVKPTL